jgi:hypothetical protein
LRAVYKDPMNMFRIGLVALGLVIGVFTLASTFAELTSQERPPFPSDPVKFSSPSAAAVPSWLEAVSPLRSDLESNHTLIVALQAVQSGTDRPAADQSARNVDAQARTKRLLSVAPYHADLWLALALLQAQHNPRDPLLVESLKVAYFIAPNDARLMAVRLDTATRFNALADPDVKEFARGDVRLMVMRQPELRPAVISAYRRASSLGKAFLEEAVQSTDPSFLPTLRG